MAADTRQIHQLFIVEPHLPVHHERRGKLFHTGYNNGSPVEEMSNSEMCKKKRSKIDLFVTKKIQRMYRMSFIFEITGKISENQ